MVAAVDCGGCSRWWVLRNLGALLSGGLAFVGEVFVLFCRLDCLIDRGFDLAVWLRSVACSALVRTEPLESHPSSRIMGLWSLHICRLNFRRALDEYAWKIRHS